MTEGARKRLGFSAIGGRKAKAEKIAAILAAAGRPLNPTDDVLDLGCGSGEIAEYLRTICRVRRADTEDPSAHLHEIRRIPKPTEMALGGLLEPLRLLTTRRNRQTKRLPRTTPEVLLNLTAPMQSTLIVLLSPK